MKKIVKVMLVPPIAAVFATGGLCGWLTATEYKPSPVETVAVQRADEGAALKPGQELTMLSWNVGYGGLGKDSDFFMDGGKNTKSADKSQVQTYLNGISDTIKENDADLVLLQEVDATPPAPTASTSASSLAAPQAAAPTRSTTPAPLCRTRTRSSSTPWAKSTAACTP